MAVDQHSLALAGRRAGRPREAHDMLCGMLDYVAISGNTSLYVNVLELAAAIIVCLDDPCGRPAWPARPKRTARSRAC